MVFKGTFGFMDIYPVVHISGRFCKNDDAIYALDGRDATVTVHAVGESPSLPDPRDEHLSDQERSMLPQCFDCNLPYSQFGADLVISHEDWARIAPFEGNGLLCATCMMRRLDATVYGLLVDPFRGNDPRDERIKELAERYRPLRDYECLERDFKSHRISKATRTIMKRFMGGYPPAIWQFVEDAIREEVRAALTPESKEVQG